MVCEVLPNFTKNVDSLSIPVRVTKLKQSRTLRFLGVLFFYIQFYIVKMNTFFTVLVIEKHHDFIVINVHAVDEYMPCSRSIIAITLVKSAHTPTLKSHILYFPVQSLYSSALDGPFRCRHSSYLMLLIIHSLNTNNLNSSDQYNTSDGEAQR